jgi:eukaryotic-like serine/threonine-protein kinase
MGASTCPPEHELLGLLADEPACRDVDGHVASCPQCRIRIQQLNAEIGNLRRVFVSVSMESGQTMPDPTASTVLWKPPVPGGYPSEAREPSVSVSRDFPSAIGKYLVVGWLDTGGQADVFRAVHPNLGKDLAIKLAHSRCDEAERDLLRQEGKVLAGLDHPNLVRVYDLDLHEGRPFLAMEYVRGLNLRQRVDLGPLSPGESAKLVAELARALAVAHRGGVTHQDIKPHNVLIDESGRPRLIDFGMARLRDAWSSASNAPSGGTLAYMAPEQARGEAQSVGPRSDLFALGGVLYFLLAGHSPYEGESLTEIWEQARNCKFDRDVLRSAKIPRELAQICLRAMAEAPADRYASADDLADRLERFGRRSFTPWIAAAAVAILGCFGLVWRWAPVKRVDVATRPSAVSPSLVEVDDPTITVRRGGQTQSSLKSALPLRTGDMIKISCELPASLNPQMFWYDASGRLEKLEANVVHGDGSPRIVYPAGGEAPLQDPIGTELVLICGNFTKPVRVEDVQRCFNGIGPLPPLPPGDFLRLGRRGVSGVRGLGTPTKDLADDARVCLDGLYERLRTRFDFVSGLTVPHREAATDATGR